MDFRSRSVNDDLMFSAAELLGTALGLPSSVGRPSFAGDAAGRAGDDYLMLSAADLLQQVLGLTLTRPGSTTEGR